MKTKVPRSLFKYVAFGERFLEQVCREVTYFADPASFNDPLDCQPVVVADSTDDELRTILAQMVVRRSQKEIDAAMRRLRLKGEKAEARRAALTQSDANRLLGDIDYYATFPDVEDAAGYTRVMLIDTIQTELKKVYERGVFCLSAKFDSPLMWSHYGDQHRGFCVEYHSADAKDIGLHKVNYGESREIKTSMISAWLVGNDPKVTKGVDRVCLLTKSREWAYEREWRMIGDIGLTDSKLRMKAVIFGMRCPPVLRYSVVKALEPRKPQLKLWEMVPAIRGYDLSRKLVERNDVISDYPQTSRAFDFEALND